ncbi:hypothetical protein [Acidovorax sp. NCPPB 4044]|uniref:hypothetical protein n=1 Tax=Acidovorax sp. NCPPB 4044 TaxID=2940490 RepID=UPI0023029AE2|nr:hypothetical protein [Acidovorax sp. NCPPB 4044]MDA8522966.1 hypothetical protein [Acidovorax sp. NCPPB 4044]
MPPRSAISLPAWAMAVLVALPLAGCSPALDWRTVRMDDAKLSALLPCKPDRATRPVALAGRSVALSMAGCDADGATFAVSHLALETAAGAAEAGSVLLHWRAATLGRIGAPASAEAAAAPFSLPGALPLPQAVRVAAEGTQEARGGRPVAVHAVWFARAEAAEGGPRLHLYHAVVYAPAPRPAVADTFFAGLSFQ